MTLNEADTRAKLIGPAIHRRGWTEDLIRREETAGTVEIIGGPAAPGVQRGTVICLQE
jgi:type I restriction enzyme R subunit